MVRFLGRSMELSVVTINFWRHFVFQEPRYTLSSNMYWKNDKPSYNEWMNACCGKNNLDFGATQNWVQISVLSFTYIDHIEKIILPSEYLLFVPIKWGSYLIWEAFMKSKGSQTHTWCLALGWHLQMAGYLQGNAFQPWLHNRLIWETFKLIDTWIPS